MPKSAWVGTSASTTVPAATTPLAPASASSTAAWGSISGSSAQASPSGGWSTAATFSGSVSMAALTCTNVATTPNQPGVRGTVTAASMLFATNGSTYGYGISTNNAGGLDIMANQAGQDIRFYAGTANNASPSAIATFAAGGFTFASSIPVSMGALTATADSNAVSFYSPKIRVASSAADIINNAPWYGLGQSNVANGGSYYYMQLAGYYGILVKTQSGNHTFNMDGSTTFSGSVSMGALTATGATLSGNIVLSSGGIVNTIGPNDVTFNRAGGENSYITQAGIGSKIVFQTSNAVIGDRIPLTLNGDGTAAFGNNVSMGALTASGASNLQNSTLYSGPTPGSNFGTLFISTGDSGNYKKYGLMFGVSGTGDTWMQSQRVDAGTSIYNLQIQPAGGSTVFGSGSGAVSMGALTATTGLFSANVQFGSGYTDFADRNVPRVFNSRYLSRNGNNLFWRSDGTNDSLVLTLANVGSAAAMLQATIALVNAPSVGTLAQMYANTPSSGTNPYWFATDQLNTNDSTYGQLFQWNGSSWVNTGLANTVTPVITAGRIQAGAIGTNALAATLVMASIITSTGYTAGTYSAAPYGFKFNGTAFTTYLLDGTSMSSFMEIGADASVGGLKAATIANRVKGNNFVQNGAGTTDVFIPDGVVSIEVTLQAAGGNGQVGAQDGGNAGQYIKKQVTVKPHNTYRLTGGAVGANSTFSWVSFDGTSGFSSDSGFTTITATFGTNGTTNSLDGANGASNPYPYQTPENGWVVNGGLGGHSANATVTSGSGGSVGQQAGGNGTTNGTYQNGGGGGASAMAPGGNGNWNQSSRAGGNGTFGSGGGSGYTAGTGGACYLRARWGF